MHKIGLKILLGWALFLPITAYSLGLGDIDVKSFLNQPLKAEISIISARPGEVDDLLVGLANRAAFTRASLSRPSHLSDLKFKVVKSEDGTSAVITVNTQSAVKEPVLNFLVEADWSKGKVFREFTILLDPPYFAQQVSKPKQKVTKASPLKQTAPVESTPVEKVEKQPEPIVNQTPVKNEEINNDGYTNESAIAEEYNYDVSSTEIAPDDEEEITETSSQESITISDGVTLWSVAKTLKNDDLSMSQVMLALQRANQDAFGKGNINNLKQGAVLRIPTQQEMADLSQREAYVEVLNQNGLWNDYVASIGESSSNAGNTKTDDSQVSNDTETEEESNSELSIVTADEGSSDKAALRSDEEVEQVSTLRKQLLLSEEETESLKVERDELSARIKMLEDELGKRNELDNIITLEDDSLAKMEQELAKNEETSEILDTAEEVTEEVTEEEPIIEVVTNEPEINDSIQDEMSDNVLNDESTQSEALVEDDFAEDETNNVVITEDIAEPEIIEEPSATETTIIVSETNSSSSMVDNIIQAVMTNPIVQGAIAGFLLLILLAVKFFKGRKDKEEEPIEEESELIEDALSEDPIDTQSGIIIPNVDDDDETPINIPDMEDNRPVDDFASTVASVNSLDDEEEDEFSKTAVINAVDMASMDAESDDEEQDETLDEVDVYLAYSLFDNAEELLKEKLAESPDRADYRAKLLDTYYATKNKTAFIDEASTLKDLGEQAEKYWPRVQTMGYELDPVNGMFAEGEGGDISELAIAKPEMADFDIGAEGEDSLQSDFDLSLDGDDTDFDLSEDKKVNEDDSSSEEVDNLPDDLGGLDFDLDESLDEPKVETNLEEINADKGLEFNLDEDIFGTDTLAIDEDSLNISFDESSSEDDVLDIDIDDIDPGLDAGLDLEISDADITGLSNTIEGATSSESNEMLETVTMPSIESINDDLDLDFSEETIERKEDEELVSFEETSNLDISLDGDDSKVVEEAEMLVEETEVMPAFGNDDDINVSDIDLNLDAEDITDIANIEGLMLPDDVDEVATKLDLAKAFHDMGDSEGARSSLEEVLLEGNDEQKEEAQSLLKEISE